MRLIRILLLTVLTSFVAYCLDPPSNDQLLILVDKAVVPLVRGYWQNANGNPSFDVVIVTNVALSRQLSKKYSQLGKSLKFEDTNAIGLDGQANLYKASKTKVYVNEFFVTSRDGDKCTVEWNRDISPLGGFTKTVTMRLVRGKWRILDIKLKSVS